MASRVPDSRDLTHERLGADFARALSTYDTQRRVQVLVDEFLGRERLAGRRVLDVGCGLGFFSERAAALGADIVACDLGPNLVRATAERAGCRAVVADALDLVSAFGVGSFDVVISSECVEHTPDPRAAISQMCQVLEPGGLLALSTPNVLWWPAVKIATWLRVRPFDGYENFSSWRALRRHFSSESMVIEREFGLHLFPFQIPLPRLSALLDRRCQLLRGLMINICLLARRE